MARLGESCRVLRTFLRPAAHSAARGVFLDWLKETKKPQALAVSQILRVSPAGFEPATPELKDRTRESRVSFGCPAVLIHQRIQSFVCLPCHAKNTRSIPSS